MKKENNCIETKPVATLTIRKLGKPGGPSVKQMTKWLRTTAAFLTKEQKNISQTIFTARYYETFIQDKIVTNKGEIDFRLPHTTSSNPRKRG